MPNIQSNKKRVLTNRKSEVTNKKKKTFLKNTIRNFNDAVVENDADKAEVYLRQSIKYLDKSVTSNIRHKNYANRKKSTLTKRMNTLKATSQWKSLFL